MGCTRIDVDILDRAEGEETKAEILVESSCIKVEE